MPSLRRRQVKKRLRIETLEQRRLLTAEGLIDYWPLDFKGSHFADAGPLRNDLIANGIGISTVDSDRGQAVALSGNHFDAPSKFDAIRGFENAVTVTAWFKSSDINRGGYVFGIVPAGLQLEPVGNQLRFSIQSVSPPVGNHVVEGEFAFENNTWYHIAGSYDGERMIVYVNGEEVGRKEADIDLDPGLNSSDYFVGSGSQNGEKLKPFKGSIDEVRLYNRALTQPQIIEIKNLPAALETSNGLSYLNADNNPVFVDPGIEIGNQVGNLQGKGFGAAINVVDVRDGDRVGIGETDSILVEDEEVFFRKNGTSTKLGTLSVSSQQTVVSVIGFTEAATPEAIEALGRAVTFASTSEQTHDRRIRLTAAAFGDLKVVRFGVPVEMQLVLESSPGASEFTPNEDAIFVDPGVEVVANGVNFREGTLTARFVEESGRESDRLLIRNTPSILRTGGTVRFTPNGFPGVVIGSVTGGESGTPLVVRLNSDATAASIEYLARAIAYDNTANETPAHARFVRFVVDDGIDNESGDVKKIEISDPPPPQNQPPKIEIPDGATTFAEGSEPVVVLPSVGISDPDSANFGGGSLRVTFAEESAREGDQLLVRSTEGILVEGGDVFNRATDPAERIGEFEILENGKVVVFYFNDGVNHDLAELIARTVHFANALAEPVPGNRFIRFELNDGDGGSDADVRRVEVAADNDPPVIEFADGATLFEEGDEPVIIDANVEVGDPDSENFAGGKLLADFVEQSRRDGDRLGIRGSEGLVVEGNDLKLVDGGQTIKVADFGFSEGALVVEFTEAANAAVAQKIARHITFGNDSSAISNDTRFIRFTVHDGDGGSDFDVRRVEVERVNNSPVVEFSDGAAQFNEGNVPVWVDRNVEIGDNDSPNFGGGRLVAEFVEQSRRDGDRLGVRGSETLVVEGNDLRIVVEQQTIKVADFGFNDGSLVIEFNGDAEVAAVQKVARHITFSNELDAISNDDRFVRFTVHDGAGGSGSDVRRIEVGNANDPPVIEFAAGPTAFAGKAVFVDARTEVADPDETDFAGGQLSVFFVEQSRREGDFVGLRPSEGLLIQGNDLRIPGAGEAIKVADFGFEEGRLIITFTERANAAAVQRVARHVVYGNELDSFADSDRFIKFLLTDGDGGEDHDVKRIAFEIPNRDPDLQVADPATAYDVDEDPVIVAPYTEIADIDSLNFAGGTLSARLIEETGREGDVLSIRGGEGIVVDGHRIFANVESDSKLIGEIREETEGISLVVDLTDHATPGLAERLARRITFGTTVGELGENNNIRFVRLSVTDGDGGSGFDVKKIELFRQPDDDQDGVDDEEEDQAPFDGDGNQDGVPDSEQDNVASVRGEGDRFVTIASPEQTRLVDVQPMENPSPDDDPGIEFPVGFFDFNVEGVESDSPTIVTINLEPGTTANTYYVFGPTPDDPNPHWYPFLYDGETGAKIFGDRIEVHYMDGERGDSDLSANGIIADPGAPGVTTHPWQNPTKLGDVNHDGDVTSLDALLILNDLRIYDPRSLPNLPSGTDQLAALFLDVSGDNMASALDALRVINLVAQDVLNNPPAESESVSAELVAPPPAGQQAASDDDDDKRIWDEAILGITEGLR